MTRIVAGSWKGHPLPKLKTGSVRPTTDRARTILFDTLGTITGYSVLDLYSGTGALGFEAISRGAKDLVSIDSDRRYIEAQKEWVRKHDAASSIEILGGRIPSVLKRVIGEFDLILADPPYAGDLPEQVLEFIQNNLSELGYFVLERSRRNEQRLDLQGISLVKEKEVAETRIQIYKAGTI